MHTEHTKSHRTKSDNRGPIIASAIALIIGSAYAAVAGDVGHKLPVTSALILQDSKEVKIQVSKSIDPTGLTEELKKAGFQVIGVSPRGEPVSEVSVYLASTETKDPAPIVEAHDASKWGPNRAKLRIVWQDDPILEPRVQEQYILPGTSDSDIDLACKRLKAKGAISVEVVR